MTVGRRQLLQVLVALACLALPNVLAHQLGVPKAGGLLSLAALAALVISARLGWRQALTGSTCLTLLIIPAAVSQNQPLPTTLVLAVAAALLGVSARWSLQPFYWLLMVSLCMAIVNLPLPLPPTPADLGRLSGLMLLCCCTSALAQGLLLPPPKATAGEIHHSWRRSLAYGVLLALAATITTPIALWEHWHITGLWLILTPFLVLRPYVKDGWRVALHRSMGTMAGVLLVLLLGLLLPQAWPLQLPAVTLAAATALIAVKHGHPALMMMGLTATIVLFNSSHSDLLLMADKRLEANAIGIGVTLGIMALAHPLEQRIARSKLVTASPQHPA